MHDRLNGRQPISRDVRCLPMVERQCQKAPLKESSRRWRDWAVHHPYDGPSPLSLVANWWGLSGAYSLHTPQRTTNQLKISAEPAGFLHAAR